eukprot:gnl/TRDRNA2_/TRDRNA2_130462_c0_seq1.p1 gnl/TRDRNA2_/TRDRNA2_130462_c0~~gnl/TRDRNA2_/TRDRNA2_130462_c0_seq1.p1  ORF type:complete len:585 (-),score=111.25 gnl/TRDRNA2_/TRDRNA2_130462_c0_seq1:125-1879(-)
MSEEKGLEGEVAAEPLVDGGEGHGANLEQEGFAGEAGGSGDAGLWELGPAGADDSTKAEFQSSLPLASGADDPFESFDQGGDFDFAVESPQMSQHSPAAAGAPLTSRSENWSTSTYLPSTKGGMSKSMVDDDGPWTTRSIKPDSQETWRERTLDCLSVAKALSKDAHAQIDENTGAKEKAARRHVTAHSNVKDQFRKKLDQTNDLIKALEDRHDSVEDTERQVGECLFTLQRSHRAKWAPLNVCERRLELREQRPLQELTRDQPQELLEHERQTLIEARQELLDHSQSCKEMHAALDQMKSELIRDLSHKRHTSRIDRTAAKHDRHHREEDEADRLFLPSLNDVSNFNLPPTACGRAPGTGHENEYGRQEDTRTLLSRAVKMEEDAMRLCNECDAVMLHTKRECTRASNQASVSLMRRCEDTAQLKRKLEAQLIESDETISAAERSLTKTKKKLLMHDAPLRDLNRKMALRVRRVTVEDIRDHVTDELEVQLESVKTMVKMLSDKYENTKDVVEKLKANREQMVEDIKCKTAALKIDDTCVKVTARKAIEMNRADPRGGRCREPAGKKSGGRPFPQVSSMLGVN